jgi:hypothetical protein
MLSTKKIFKVIKDKQNGYLENFQCKLTHALGNHNQALTAQTPVWLGHHTDRVETERDDMVNHRSSKITIALGHPVNGS